jgi:hypothetical protein
VQSWLFSVRPSDSWEMLWKSTGRRGPISGF